MLQILGISDLQEHIYRVLLRRPTATVSELGAQTGVQSGVLRALRRLEQYGLLRRSSRAACGYVPVAPDLAVSALVNQRRSELDLVETSAREYVDEFVMGQHLSHPASLVQVITGSEAIAELAVEMYETVSKELLCFDTPPYVTPVHFDEVETELPLLKRGVRIQSLYSRQAVETVGKAEIIFELCHAGEEARVAEELPIKLLVVDRQQALLPLSGHSHEYDSAVRVHASGMLDALISLFEYHWDAAIPIERDALADQSPGPRTDARQLLLFLASGVKDEVIARRLGVSMRTARRRIYELQKSLGATTRFQAGAQAVRRGWL